MRDCTMVVTGAVTISGAVSPKLSQLASGASYPRGAPLADLHAVRRAFAGPPRVRFRLSWAQVLGICMIVTGQEQGQLKQVRRPAADEVLEGIACSNAGNRPRRRWRSSAAPSGRPRAHEAAVGVFSGKWHAVRCPGASSASGGSVVRQIS
jgi:hypothetical protein